MANNCCAVHAIQRTGAGASCQKNPSNYIAMQLSYTVVPQDDNSLMTALVNNGPVSVGVAVGAGFEAYSSGIIDPASACGRGINHAVLLVGYGTDAKTGIPYWLFKNR